MDCPDSYMCGVGALLIRLREIHEDDLQVACIVYVVGNPFVEIELDRPSLVINQTEEVALDAADLVGPDLRSLGQIDLLRVVGAQPPAPIVPKGFHPSTHSDKQSWRTPKLICRGPPSPTSCLAET